MDFRVRFQKRALKDLERLVRYIAQDDATMERRFRRIPEFGGRVLRVAVNTTVEPNRVASVFFDRKMKGKL